MRGPTKESNWLIPGRVLAGGYPASSDDAEMSAILRALLDAGVTTFVCLQAEVDSDGLSVCSAGVWATAGLRPYLPRVRALAEATSRPPPSFLHMHVADGHVGGDAETLCLADACCERLACGEVLYIHCWGGHGRTGTLAALLLGRLYGLPLAAALRHVQSYHDTRVNPAGARSPQTAVQRAQVRRLLSRATTPAAVAVASCYASASASAPSSPAAIRHQWAPIATASSGPHVAADDGPLLQFAGPPQAYHLAPHDHCPAPRSPPGGYAVVRPPPPGVTLLAPPPGGRGGPTALCGRSVQVASAAAAVGATGAKCASPAAAAVAAGAPIVWRPAGTGPLAQRAARSLSTLLQRTADQHAAQHTPDAHTKASSGSDGDDARCERDAGDGAMPPCMLRRHSDDSSACRAEPPGSSGSPFFHESMSGWSTPGGLATPLGSAQSSELAGGGGRHLSLH
ncbi:hypothetical protein FOA52_006325 [Chlamydomonas sp. UWO 241]|nr:hypothetical protein FOA52_006325 [Chlamydomonas sp. UWO 241]